MTKGDSGGEQHRPSSEERSQKQKLCRYFKNGKCLHGDNCRWSHDLPKDSSKDSQTTGMAAGIRVMTTTSSSFRVPYFKRVLVDTGANELIRPYSNQWWIDIECNKCEGTRVKMKLAGNVTQPGLMTDIGEVMMRDGLKRNDYDIGWILPVSRIQEELCVEARWRGDGTAALYFPDGKVVELIKEQGLAFMKYEDFWPIRKQLAESHRKGRPSACPRAVCAETNVVYRNHCIASTQTEEDNMWENWIDQKVVEDGNEFSLQTWLTTINQVGVDKVAYILSVLALEIRTNRPHMRIGGLTCFTEWIHLVRHGPTNFYRRWKPLAILSITSRLTIEFQFRSTLQPPSTRSLRLFCFTPATSMIESVSAAGTRLGCADNMKRASRSPPMC